MAEFTGEDTDRLTTRLARIADSVRRQWHTSGWLDPGGLLLLREALDELGRRAVQEIAREHESTGQRRTGGLVDE